MDKKDYLNKTENNRRTFLKTVGIGITAAGLGGTPTIAQQTDEEDEQPVGWTTHRANPERTGTIDATGPTPYPTTDWTLDPDGTLFGVEPIVTDGTVYLATTTNNTPSKYDGYVGAFDAQTGEQQWIQSEIPAPTTPTIADEMVYITTKRVRGTNSSRSGLYALDAESGDIAWKQTQQDQWTVPLIAEETVYVANENGAHAFDPATGDNVWRKSGVGGIAHGYEGQVSYADGTLIYADGTALNARDGAMEWQTPSDQPMLGNSTADNERVYFLQGEYIQGNDHRISVEARSIETGRIDWTHTNSDNFWDGRLAVANGHVFLFEDFNGTSAVIALSAETGAEAWRQELHGDFVSNPTVANEMIYLGGRHEPESPFDAGRAFIAALELETGEENWKYLLDSSDLETSPENPPAAGTPVVVGDQLFTATYPAGSTLDYEYVYYSNVFSLGSCDTRPDADDCFLTDEQPNESELSQPEACIDSIAQQDLSELPAGETVWLNGYCSTGRELQYEWDTDDDGQYDAMGPTVVVPTPTCGAIPISLRVTDFQGNTDRTTVTLSTV
ncbi:PQQ-binding-like beta-propeller repeat protein [Haladaptatus pallidirubidus]|uniref:Pyrrolo-quinoline quinone repeat domain-containing protein n=1 Tax=Haladaptatus pallidirubidus TaxID=1008152 RepID=A0AAV3UI52_9EURY|nr:PQQ-binding-like beta-propeller repeat protein [Haladaptatus pallidirubidus]